MVNKELTNSYLQWLASGSGGYRPVGGYVEVGWKATREHPRKL